MPGLDRTGPQSQGAKTGRGMGFCNRNLTSENTNKEGVVGVSVNGGQGMGRRLGRGNGMGFGRGQRRRAW